MDDTVVLYDVPLWLEDDEVIALIKPPEAGVLVESTTIVSWRPGDMALSAWRIKGSGLLGLVGTVMRDEDTDACVYLVGNRQYNAERPPQKEASGKRKGKGKGSRGNEPTGSNKPVRRWNIFYADAA